MPETKKVLIEEQILKDLASNIRQGLNIEEKIVPSNFNNYIQQLVQEKELLKSNQKELMQQMDKSLELIKELENCPPIKTCTVILDADLDIYLHGYSATTYKNGKFFCNYVLPQMKECYKTLTIENIVAGSILTLTVSAKKLPIKFDGIDCLESSKDFYMYHFKVNKDTTIHISN